MLYSTAIYLPVKMVVYYFPFGSRAQKTSIQVIAISFNLTRLSFSAAEMFHILKLLYSIVLKPGISIIQVGHCVHSKWASVSNLASWIHVCFHLETQHYIQTAVAVTVNHQELVAENCSHLFLYSSRCQKCKLASLD